MLTLQRSFILKHKATIGIVSSTSQAWLISALDDPEDDSLSSSIVADMSCDRSSVAICRAQFFETRVAGLLKHPPLYFAQEIKYSEIVSPLQRLALGGVPVCPLANIKSKWVFWKEINLCER